MQLKSIAVIAFLLLVVASLLVAGYITITTNTTNQTPSASATQSVGHGTLLESYLVELKKGVEEDKNISVKAWDLTWINNTSAVLQLATVNKPTNITYAFDQTFIQFPTIQDATNYLNATNKAEYSLASTQSPSGGAYQKATGHAPQIFKQYVWNEGNPSNISEYKYHEITQDDNIIRIITGKTITLFG
ncbi:MAG: hypothetical protein ACXW02_07995 [Halobacteriota archaeon]|jgi:hypothetical protein